MRKGKKLGAADFICQLEEGKVAAEITEAEERTLFKDMSNILDQVGTCASSGVTFYRRFGMLRVETNKYRRVYEDGTLLAELWFLDGANHREGDEPAYIEYYKSGKVKVEEWCIKDKNYRTDDKPAHIEYHENGDIKRSYSQTLKVKN